MTLLVGRDLTIRDHKAGQVPPEALEAVYARMCAERRLLGVFASLDDFREAVSRSDARLFLVDVWGLPAGFFWLSNAEGLSAELHFCFWREVAAAGHAVSVSRAVLRWLAGQGLRSVVGRTPVRRKAALRLAESLGFRFLGVVPGGDSSGGDVLISVCDLAEVFNG